MAGMPSRGGPPERISDQSTAKVEKSALGNSAASASAGQGAGSAAPAGPETGPAASSSAAARPAACRRPRPPR